MPTPYETAIGSWTRRSTFFWAATGATVGLSNLWQFPYLARSHGGGAFILIYLACLLLVTLPLMLTETAIGRHSRHGIVLAMDGLIRSARQPRWWMWAGRLSILSAFLVLSFTVVIGAICLAYVFYGALGRFSPGDELGAAALLNDLVANPSDYREFMAWHGFFIVLVLWVSVQGVVGGLERALRVVVPGFLVLLVALLLFSARHGDVPAALQHMLSFRTDDVTWGSLRAALFHAFFTLGLGMGVWAIFGSYMPAIAPLKRSVVAVVLMDTLIAVMAGLVLYALVLPHAPASGSRASPCCSWLCRSVWRNCPAASLSPRHCSCLWCWWPGPPRWPCLNRWWAGFANGPGRLVAGASLLLVHLPGLSVLARCFPSISGPIGCC